MISPAVWDGGCIQTSIRGQNFPLVHQPSGSPRIATRKIRRAGLLVKTVCASDLRQFMLHDCHWNSLHWSSTETALPAPLRVSARCCCCCCLLLLQNCCNVGRLRQEHRRIVGALLSDGARLQQISERMIAQRWTLQKRARGDCSVMLLGAQQALLPHLVVPR